MEKHEIANHARSGRRSNPVESVGRDLCGIVPVHRRGWVRGRENSNVVLHLTVAHTGQGDAAILVIERTLPALEPERYAGVVGKDSSQIPAPDDFVQNVVVQVELLALARWQVIGEIGVEDMAHVVVRRPPVQTHISQRYEILLRRVGEKAQKTADRKSVV